MDVRGFCMGQNLLAIEALAIWLSDPAHLSWGAIVGTSPYFHRASRFVDRAMLFSMRATSTLS